MKRKFTIFFRTLFIALFSAACIASLTVFIAVADTGTRKIGFGDDTPAICITEYRESVNVVFFGSSFDIDLKKTKQAAEEAEKIAECALPPAVRLAENLFGIFSSD